MPLKLGPMIVEGHRPDPIKNHFPSAKDRGEQRLAKARIPLPARQDKPLLRVSRVTPYTRFPGVAAVNREMARLPVLDSAQEISRNVCAHLHAHRVMTGRPHPRVLLLGEMHGYPSSLAMGLAVLRELRNVPGEKCFLAEQLPSTISAMFPPDDPGLRTLQRKLACDEPLRFHRKLADAPVFRGLRTMGAYAKLHGFNMAPCDPDAYAANQEIREGGMAAAVINAAASSPLTIVLVGPHHVPILHEEMSSRHDTLTMAITLPVQQGDTDAAKRHSYLLAKTEILKMVPSKKLDETPLDAVHFINHIL